MTAKDLKNALLQEAVQGKLVPQIASEGNAKDLLEEIKKEKAKLIKEGKLKKEKPLPEITDDEIPFDIPENWCWCKFGDISINRDCDRIPLSVSQREHLKKIYDYYGASGVIDKVDNYLFDKPLLLIGEDGANLLNRSTPIAFIATGKYWVNNHAHVLDFDERYIYMKFIMCYINSISLAKYVTGTAQPKMNQEKMNSIPVPLPPLAEQKRIVAAIEQFIPLIEEYEKKGTELTALNADIAKTLKNAILQEAVQGKLAPQITSEGNAKDLLEEIKKEKAKLIKEGKLKKEKPLPEITEDEIPFDIPENWCWCRLSEYLDIRDGTHDSPKFYDAGIPFVTSKNLDNGKLDFSTCKYITEEDHKKFSARSFVEDGDILFAMIGSIGNPVIVKKKFDFSFKNMALFKRYSSEKTDMKYIFYYLTYIQNKLKRIATGGVQSFIGLNTFRQMLFPLPPIEEQRRIVDSIEKMLPLSKKIGD